MYVTIYMCARMYVYVYTYGCVLKDQGAEIIDASNELRQYIKNLSLPSLVLLFFFLNKLKLYTYTYFEAYLMRNILYKPFGTTKKSNSKGNTVIQFA